MPNEERPELQGQLRLSWDGYSQPDEPRIEGIPLRVLQLYAQHHGYRLIGPAEAAVLDAAAAIPDRDIVQVASCPDPKDVGAALARAEVARRTGTTVAEVGASIERVGAKLGWTRAQSQSVEQAQRLLRERLERWRDDMEFDGDWEEYVRVCLTRLLNGQEREQ